MTYLNCLFLVFSKTHKNCFSTICEDYSCLQGFLLSFQSFIFTDCKPVQSKCIRPSIYLTKLYLRGILLRLKLNLIFKWYKKRISDNFNRGNPATAILI